MNVSKLLSESVKKVSACILEMSVKRRCILFLTTLLFGTVWVSFYFTPDLANTLFPNRASKKGSGFQPVPEQQLPWQRHSLALSSLEISSSLQLQGCSRVKVTSKWGNYALLFAEILSDVFFSSQACFPHICIHLSCSPGSSLIVSIFACKTGRKSGFIERKSLPGLQPVLFFTWFSFECCRCAENQLSSPW